MSPAKQKDFRNFSMNKKAEKVYQRFEGINNTLILLLISILLTKS